jgi:hypothetical protein
MDQSGAPDGLKSVAEAKQRNAKRCSVFGPKGERTIEKSCGGNDN